MGYPTMFYITESNKDFLKEINNKSELINQLLDIHFKSKKEISEADLIKDKKIINIEMEALKKIREIENEYT